MSSAPQSPKNAASEQWIWVRVDPRAPDRDPAVMHAMRDPLAKTTSRALATYGAPLPPVSRCFSGAGSVS